MGIYAAESRVDGFDEVGVVFDVVSESCRQLCLVAIQVCTPLVG